MPRGSLVALLLAAACAPPAPDGVWLFHMEAEAEEACTSSVTHSFLHAWEPDEEDADPWTDSEGLTESESLFLGLVTSTGPDTAVLVIGDETFLGTTGDDGDWAFTWTGTTASSAESSHASGYLYTDASTRTDTRTWDLVLESETRFTGEASWGSSSTESWTESDTWSEELSLEIGETGRIPVGGYLVTTDGAGGTMAASNHYAVLDCSIGDCTLEATETCSAASGVEGDLTDLDPDAWAGVRDAGQAAGAG